MNKSIATITLSFISAITIYTILTVAPLVTLNGMANAYLYFLKFNKDFYVEIVSVFAGLSILYLVSRVLNKPMMMVNPVNDPVIVNFDSTVSLDPLDDYQDLPLSYYEIPRLSKVLAERARSELHITSNSTALEMKMLKEWSNRELHAMNVRKIDRAKIIPYVVRLSRLETRHERNAREMEMSELYQRHLEMTRRRLWSYSPPSWEHWFGVLHFESSPQEV